MAVDRSRILASAQKQISKGNYDKAILEYQKLVKDDPSDVRTWLKIGDLHTRRGARPEAIETYARVAEHYAGQGFFLKAVAVYKQILKLDSARLDISLRLADMYEQLELVSDALSTYEQVAGAYARNGDVEQALETLARMCDLDPENIPIRIKLAEALSKAGKTKEAAQEFETGAHLLRSQGRIDDYIKVAERLLYHRQDDLETAIALARLYLDRNDAKRALAKLQLCFKANPRDIGTLELLARAFHMLEQIPKTISVYREIVRILHETNKPEERARILKAILELDPGDAEARQALAGYAPRSRPPAAITPPPSAVVEPSGAVPAEEVDDWDLEPSVRRRVTVKPPRPTPLQSTQQREATEPLKRPPVTPPNHPRPEPLAPQSLERKAKESESGMMLLDDDELIEEFEGEDQGAQGHVRLTSIPPDVAQEAQIARLLTECEVFQRYGLRSKVIEQLSLVIQLDPSHRQAREILANTYAEEGLLQEALQELGQLISLTEVALPEAAEGYRAQIQALDPEDPRAAPAALNPQEHYQDTAPLDRATFEEDEEVLFVDDESDLIDLTASDVRLEEAVEYESIVPPPADLMVPTRDLPRHRGPAGSASPPEAGTLPAPWEQRNSSGPFEAKGYPFSIPGDKEANERFAPPDSSQELPGATTPFEVAHPPAAPFIAREIPKSIQGDPALEAPISPREFNETDTTEADLRLAKAEAQKRLSMPPGEIEETLDEVDFFLAQGIFDEARFTLQDMLNSHPNHPLLLDKAKEIEEMAAAAAAQVSIRPSQYPDQSFELAEKLAEELGHAEDATNPGSDVLDVEQVFAQFKEGIEQQVSADDSDTHFDLGIAYKEMELLDDAIQEFELAMSSPKRECTAHTMIGLCLIEKSQFAEAISRFKRGLNAKERNEHEELGLYFEIGHAYELLHDAKEALYYYQKVQKRHPDFRGVGERIRNLTQSPSTSYAEIPPDPTADDVDAAFDELMGDDAS